MSFGIDPNDFHMVCCATPTCLRVFDDEEEIGDVAAHYWAEHPDIDIEVSGNMAVELVPQCHMCGSPKVRIQSKVPEAFKCHACGILMQRTTP